jgi:hypothetical protein
MSCRIRPGNLKFYDVLEADAGCRVVPTVAAMAVSGGGSTVRLMPCCAMGCSGGSTARPDAVLLALHGAMCTEEADDGDGFPRRVRSVVGRVSHLRYPRSACKPDSAPRGLCVPSSAIARRRTSTIGPPGRGRRAFSGAPCQLSPSGA